MKPRAEKFLEGFKLGSLGAGRKPIRASEPEGRIRIHDEGLVFLALSANKEKAPYLYWEDPDGWFYLLELSLDHNSFDFFTIYLYGGENLKAAIGSSSITPMDYEWAAKFILRDQEFKNMVAHYKKIVSAIKKEGIDGSFKEAIFKPFQPSEAEFNVWLKKKWA